MDVFAHGPDGPRLYRAEADAVVPPAPTMDDEAASQQLMSEARAPHSTDFEGPAIPLNLNGASRTSAKKTPDSGKKRTRRLGRTQKAHRDTVRGSPLPAAYSLQDLQAFIGTSPSKSRAVSSSGPSTQIEVPDTQAEMQANGVPSPTPLTASQAVSSNSSNKRTRKGKKSKKEEQSEAEPNNSNAIPATPYEEPAGDAIPSPSEAPKSESSRKRRRKDKPRSSLDSVNMDTTEISETPAVTQEAAEGTSAEEVVMQSEYSDADELPLTPRDLLGKLNAERSQKSQSASKVQSPDDAHEDASEEQDIEAESDAEPTVEDSDAEGASSPGEQSSNSEGPTRYSVGGVVRRRGRGWTSKADPNKTYQRARDDDERTAADKALETTHELGHPPDKRTSGDYTADEKELIRRAIRDYQERNGLDTADLVEIIQYSPQRNKGSNDHQTEAQFKNDCNAFWDEIANVGLLRKPHEVRKHIRTTYHMCQRNSWSDEDDDQLRNLVNLHPGQWRLIATQLNRLLLDVYNRWNDYLRHGENRNTKRWSPDEEENFVRVLSIVCQRVEDSRAEDGKPPLDDYYSVINWHEVCRELDHTRSRLQCQSKWKIMRARVPPARLDVEIKPRETPTHEEAPQKKERPKSKAKESCEPDSTEADPSPPSAGDMLWGDKFDLVAELSEQAATNEITSDNQIVWQDVTKNMDHKWSVRTLQTAFRQLNELVLDDEDDEDLTHRLGLLYNYIKENHRDQIEDRYQAAQDLQADDEYEPQVNSSKKRKRQSVVGSDTDATKKRSKRTVGTAQKSKQKELVTDSEPEL